MKLKKILSLLLACVMFALMMTGCAGQTATNDGRISISMYMWDRSMFKELSPWLEEKFPNIDFTFVQSYNTMEYYKDLLARGEEMPDIITCRRFSLNDAAPLSEHLADLSKTEVADTYIEHPTFCNCPMPEDLKAKRADYIVNDFTSQEYIREALTQTQQFLEPTDYVTIVKGY